MKNVQQGKHLSLPEYIYGHVRELIQTDVFPVGSQLPSEKQLAQDLCVSRAVLREALQRLELDGYIDRLHGVGTFVKTHVPTLSAGLEQLGSMTTLIEQKGRTPGTTCMVIKEVLASAEAADALQIEVGTPVVCFERVRTADGVPFAFDIAIAQRGMLDPDFFIRYEEESLFAYLEEVKEHHLTHAYCHVSAENAPEDIARKLNIEAGTALQVLAQTYFDQEEVPIYYGKSYINNDQLTFHVLRRR